MSTRRWGMSLVELLVVLAILGVLAALTLAGVQRVRASAARTACANNVRQVGLALTQYHQTHGSFPPGLERPGSQADMPYLAWSARILPYLEQGAVWDEVVRSYRAAPPRGDAPVPPNHPVAYRVLPAFLCPADSRVRTPPDGTRGLNSYMGVAGTRAELGDGSLFFGSTVKLADIADGASNTILIGERPPSADLRFGWWHSGWGQRTTGSAYDTYLGVADLNYSESQRFPEFDCPVGPYTFRSGRLSDQCDTFHFWSPHPGGAHFALADGSVRFVSYSAAALLPALSTRTGREGVAVPD